MFRVAPLFLTEALAVFINREVGWAGNWFRLWTPDLAQPKLIRRKFYLRYLQEGFHCWEETLKTFDEELWEIFKQGSDCNRQTFQVGYTGGYKRVVHLVFIYMETT